MKFEQIGYAVFVASEVQFLYAIWCKWGQHSKTALQQFWSVVASTTGLGLAAYWTLVSNHLE